MSYKIKSFGYAVCDQPDCGAFVPGEDAADEIDWQPDAGYADEAAEAQGWQIVGDGIRSHHYCPDHIHAECEECGRREVGELGRLEKAGWIDPRNTGDSLCPDCASK